MAPIVHSICVTLLALSAGCVASPDAPAGPAAGDADALEMPAVESAIDTRLIVGSDDEPGSISEPTARPNARKVAKCAAAIAVVATSTALPITKVAKVRAFVRSAGGVYQAAKILVYASTPSEKAAAILRVIGAGAAEILSIDAIIENC